MTKHHKDSMNPELGKQLNERKKQSKLKSFRNWLSNVTKGNPLTFEEWRDTHPHGTYESYLEYVKKFNETKAQVERITIEDKAEPLTPEQIRLREIAQRIHEEDYPPERWTVDLWDTEKRQKEYDRSSGQNS